MKTILLALIAATAFCQTVKVAPYYSAGAGTAQLTTTATTDSSIDWIAAGQTDRMMIPRAGSITKVRLYIGDRTAISNMYIGVCRWSTGSTWNVAQWSAAITGPFFANEVNTFTLATPLAAQKYDVMCGRIEWSTPHTQNLAALSSILLPSIAGNGNTVQSENCYYQLNAAKPSSLTTGSMTLIPGNGCSVIEAWMTRPDIVAIGDSLLQKDDSNADGGAILSRPLSASVGQSGLSIPYYVTSRYSGLSYQNMGWGGQTTAQIQARFAQDALALKPSYIVLDGGVNDVYLELLDHYRLRRRADHCNRELTCGDDGGSTIRRNENVRDADRAVDGERLGRHQCANGFDRHDQRQYNRGRADIRSECDRSPLRCGAAAGKWAGGKLLGHTAAVPLRRWFGGSSEFRGRAAGGESCIALTAIVSLCGDRCLEGNVEAKMTLELAEGFEPPTRSLQNCRSTN